MNIRAYQLFIATACAAVLGFGSAIVFMDKKADSTESHLVLNYIANHGLTLDLMDRFNAINNDWPPSRNKLANLLLDAQRQVQERSK
ncbi:MAG: hypothetical protein V4713_03960 [Pseudomonadota bacterium]